MFNGECVTPLRYGSHCTEDIQCIMSGYECRNSLCLCGDTLTWDGNRCEDTDDDDEPDRVRDPAERVVVKDDVDSEQRVQPGDVGVALGKIFGPLGFIICILIFIGVFIVFHNSK